jgi:hypothetical protein
MLPSAMPRGLSQQQIEAITRDLLTQRRAVTVRDVMHSLRVRFGSAGRTQRVCEVLKRLESEGEPSRMALALQSHEFQLLRERARAAEARAALSEERERRHQDLWAARYAEKLEELERLHARPAKATGGVTHEQYLRVYQRAAELARRLARYEDPDKPALDADR